MCYLQVPSIFKLCFTQEQMLCYACHAVLCCAMLDKLRIQGIPLSCTLALAKRETIYMKQQ